MNVFILGGQNPRHASWVREFAESARARGHRAEFVDYRNWVNDDPTTDVPHELDAAASAVTAFDGEYVIAAKSIGTVITTFGVERGLLGPRATLLLGFPLDAVKHDAEIGGAAQLLPATTVIQNEADPFGSAQAVEQFFAEHGPDRCRVESVPGDDTHDYRDFEHYLDELEAMLGTE